MSSRKVASQSEANKTSRKRTKAGSVARKAISRAAEVQTVAPVDADLSSAARALAASIERGLRAGEDGLAPEAIQALMGAACRAYSAQVAAGNDFMPLSPRTAVNSTDIMITASGLLRSASLAAFELGMWQSWTGR